MTDFEGLWESAPDALVGVDQGGVIRLVNHQMELLFGYERSEMVGQLIETLVPDSFRTVHQAQGEGHIADPGGARAMGAVVELSGRRRDGTEFPADISVSWIDTKDGPMVTAAVRDVTDRKRADQDLQRLAAIIQNSGDAIICETRDGIPPRGDDRPDPDGPASDDSLSTDSMPSRPVTVVGMGPSRILHPHPFNDSCNYLG